MFFIEDDIVSVNPPELSLCSDDNPGGFRLSGSYFLAKELIKSKKKRYVYTLNIPFFVYGIYPTIRLLIWNIDDITYTYFFNNIIFLNRK